MLDPVVQLLAAVKSLPHDLNRHVTHSMFTNDVLEPYETLKGATLKRGDLTDR